MTRLRKGERDRWTRITFPATELGVRQTMCGLRAALENAGADRDDTGTVEIAVAEALNNIVEHGNSATVMGHVTARWRIEGGYVDVELADTGLPIPGLCLPDGRLPALGRDLPEGGFGWFLIRTLSHRLSYARSGGTNRLRLGFDLHPAGCRKRDAAPKAPH